ncbi:MAG: DNA-3-methyladenine glycosylase 2 family protein [Candidatus Omnitrophica bacterium]|nr:DNA-3-methyladenine glycosylase 2 family protein [Candidatus Omnitrophota bacterium]
MQNTLTVQDFNLSATLDSGQVFGFTRRTDQTYEGAIFGSRVRVFQKSFRICVEASSKKFTETVFRRYFDLDRDLNSIQEILCEEGFKKQLEPIWGLRLIQQDSWEALACFIISSNNNIKRIQGIWHNLTQKLSKSGSSFPNPTEIARSHERVLRELGLGYRAPYLLRAAQFVSVNPDSLQVIRNSDYGKARERLLRFPGIGPKVADCALLYGFQKYEAFPVDIWMLRTMRKYYFKNRSVTEEKVHRFAQEKWGSHAGYIQQYLFHGARMGFI